jgi:hypothetical protein
VRQGGIYEHKIGGSRYRVLVVSADAHNITRTPWVAPIRHGRVDIPPYLVALHEADPLGGSVDLDRLGRATLTGDPVGMVTGSTMSRIRDSIAAVLAG